MYIYVLDSTVGRYTLGYLVILYWVRQRRTPRVIVIWVRYIHSTSIVAERFHVKRSINYCGTCMPTASSASCTYFPRHDTHEMRSVADKKKNDTSNLIYVLYQPTYVLLESLSASFQNRNLLNCVQLCNVQCACLSQVSPLTFDVR